MPLFLSHNVTHENVVFWPFVVKREKKLDSLIQSKKEKDRELVTNRPLAIQLLILEERKNFKDNILRHQVMKLNHYSSSMPTSTNRFD